MSAGVVGEYSGIFKFYVGLLIDTNRLINDVSEMYDTVIVASDCCRERGYVGLDHIRKVLKLF